MPNDPKYVRLRVGLRGRYDMTSGWGIAGLDVKHMPDPDSQPNAHAYVKRELKAGRLEGASRAEYDEVHVAIADSPVVDEEATDPPYQERSVRERARAQHNKILASRESSEGEDAHDVDTRRRKDLLKEQKKQEKKAAKKRSKAEAEDDARGSDTTSADAYDDMDFGQLKEAARSRDLPANGGTEDLKARLREADQATE